jgi:hypothetical protein
MDRSAADGSEDEFAVSPSETALTGLNAAADDLTADRRGLLYKLFPLCTNGRVSPRQIVDCIGGYPGEGFDRQLQSRLSLPSSTAQTPATALAPLHAWRPHEKRAIQPVVANIRRFSRMWERAELRLA